MLTDLQLSELKSFIQELGDLARKVVLPYWTAKDVAIEIKSDGSPVTLADKNCERELRKLIEERYPTHGIIGEEFGNKNEFAEFVWVLDPIDGTKSFVSKIPLFGVLIGLLYQGKPLLGLIDQPVTNERIWGDCQSAYYNGEKVSVSKTISLKDSLLLSTDIVDIKLAHSDKNWEKLLSEVRLFRTWGDCYSYLMLACGRADIVADPILSPWDMLPLLPILQGAGAKFSGWDGIFSLESTTSILAANPILHEKALSALKVL